MTPPYDGLLDKSKFAAYLQQNENVILNVRDGVQGSFDSAARPSG